MQIQQLSNQLMRIATSRRGRKERIEYLKGADEMRNDPYPSLICHLSEDLDCLLVWRHTICLGDIWELSQRDECWKYTRIHKHDKQAWPHEAHRIEFKANKNGEETWSLTRTALFPEVNCALFVLIGALHMDKYEFITTPGKVRRCPSQSCFAAWWEVHCNSNVPPRHVPPKLIRNRLQFSKTLWLTKKKAMKF